MMTALIDERTGAPDRFIAPLYTVSEGAQYLGVPQSTLSSWSHGYTKRRTGHPDTSGKPILTTVQRIGSSRGPVIPFIGLAEGVVLTAIRRAGVPLQRIRPALARLDDEVGLRHALASRRLYTDGAEVLYDFAAHSDDAGESEALRELVVVRSGQHVFNEVVRAYLRRLEFGEDGYAQLIRLPGYDVAEVLVDPGRGFGQPIFARGGARIEDALSMFQAGESLDTVAAEYRVPPEQLEDVVRVATLRAA
jgi:uncharacterized protein (DUF433 family)